MNNVKNFLIIHYPFFVIHYLSFPSQRISGRNIFHYDPTFLRFAVAVAHMLAEFDGGRKIIAVRVLKGAKNAALFHKFINLAQNFLADIVRNRDKRQTANNKADFSEFRFLMKRENIAGVSAHKTHMRIIYL